MRFETKKLRLKDGRSAILRTPDCNDAAGLLSYIRQACGETDFLSRYPEEWEKVTVESEEKWIESRVASPNSLLLVCIVDGRVVGNCEISRLSGKKTEHRATVAIAVLREFWSLGIGKAMFEAMLDAARSWHVMLVELEFIEGNDRARRLYERMSFSVVSEKPNAFRSKDGTLHTEYYMQKYF